MAEDSISEHIKNVRREFSDSSFDRKDIHKNPFVQFKEWMSNAIDSKILDPYATCLSTVDLDGGADARIVYLRDILDDGYVLFTNYNSAKGIQIEKNPKVSLNFLWNELSRQVKIKGIASLADKSMSDDYFAKRPRNSQLGAWASEQSQSIENREILVERLKEIEERFEGGEVPRPPHWGGIKIMPTYFEFWKGRASRLHDRFVYEIKDGVWVINRLSP
ncbi:MAG: pyridoxamine 5'-phosphate oxidase [Patiriisocius sp.]|jgi:pyridoxamine 5'-phosphate oxidase